MVLCCGWKLALELEPIRRYYRDLMKLSDVFDLLLLAMLWGGSFLFMRIAAPVIGPVWLIGLRVGLAGLLLLLLIYRQNLFGTLRENAWTLFIVGVGNSAIPFLLFAYASVSLPAGLTAILNATAPLFGVVVATVWLKERLTFGRFLGFLSGFIGVVLLIGLRPFEATTQFYLAIGAGLLAAIFYAFAAPYISQHLKGVPSLAVAAGSQLSAAIFTLPLFPFTVPSVQPSTLVVVSVLVLAIFSTAYAYILYFRLIQNVGSSKALTVTYLIPVFAMIFGAIFLGEQITLSMVIGCGLILLGTAIANDLVGSFRPRS